MGPQEGQAVGTCVLRKPLPASGYPVAAGQAKSFDIEASHTEQPSPKED
jgi:hypothetical protein